MPQNCVPMKMGAELGRSWSDIRGELSIYLLVTVAIGTGLMWYEDAQVRRQQIETTKAFHKVLEMHTDTIVQAIELQKRLGSSPQQ